MATISVGCGADFTDLATAVSASASGDEIRITGPLDLPGPIETPHKLRFVGVGLRPVLTFDGLLPHGVGILTTRGDTFVENIEFRRARSLTGNGAGLWHAEGDLEVSGCVFAQNQNGLMIATGEQGTARVSQSSFVANGAGCGHTHGIYATSGGGLDVEGCSFEDTCVGHHLKSRTLRLRVVGNYFGCMPGATTSYAVDICHGGAAEVAHNLLVKGRSSMSRKFIAFCSEARRHPGTRLDVQSNIFISHRRDPSVAVVNFAHAVPARLQANAYEGRVIPLLGRGRNRDRQHPGTAVTRGTAATLAAAD